MQCADWYFHPVAVHGPPGAISGVFAWSIALLALAVITFFPFGLYLMIGVGLPLKLLGVSWLGYLAAGFLIVGQPDRISRQA